MFEDMAQRLFDDASLLKEDHPALWLSAIKLLNAKMEWLSLVNNRIEGLERFDAECDAMVADLRAKKAREKARSAALRETEHG